MGRLRFRGGGNRSRPGDDRATRPSPKPAYDVVVLARTAYDSVAGALHSGRRTGSSVSHEAESLRASDRPAMRNASPGAQGVPHGRIKRPSYSAGSTGDRHPAGRVGTVRGIPARLLSSTNLESPGWPFRSRRVLH